MGGSSIRREVAHFIRVSYDVVLAWALTAAAYVTMIDAGPSILRTILGGLVLFVVPGYVLVAALFPRRSNAAPPLRSRAADARLSCPERLALSIGVSVALVPLLGHLLGATTGFDWRAVLQFLAIGIGAMGIFAVIRRFQVPAAERFYPPFGAWLAGGLSEFGARSLGGKVVLLGLVGSILLSGTTIAYVLSVPQSGERFTDLHVVSTDGSGNHVSAGYPVSVRRGDPATLTVGVHNFEGEPMEYEVVVTIERVVDSNGEARVVEKRELDRFGATVGPDEQWNRSHTVRPPLAGENLHLNYYLYRDEAPKSPVKATAYRHVYIWMDVTPNSTTSTNTTRSGPR